MNTSSWGKALFIASLAALYIPAVYILSDQYFFTTLRDREHILPTPSGTPEYQSPENEIGKSGIKNSTLGFEKVFYISMPERTDRQDAMKLIASFMDLDLTYVPGVNGSTIVEKALPYNSQKKPPKVLTMAELGCWRAHANIWIDIIQSGISSALILEDDIDFTVGIRDVLAGVSEHLQRLTGAENGEAYGLVGEETWDVLHLGHCWNERPPEKTYPVASKIYEAWEDEYAPVKEQYAQLLPEAKSQRIRVLQPTYVVVCTQAYVVSLAGARRLLYHIGGPGGTLYEPIDLVMMNLFRSGKIKGYTAVPSIFSQWKNGDFRDTDIQQVQKPEEVEKGSGGDVIKSVRQEIRKAWGGRAIWEDIESKSMPAISKRTRRLGRS